MTVLVGGGLLFAIWLGIVRVYDAQTLAIIVIAMALALWADNPSPQQTR